MEFKKKIATLTASVTLCVTLLAMPMTASAAGVSVGEIFNGKYIDAALYTYSNSADGWTGCTDGIVDNLSISIRYNYQLGTSTYTYSQTGVNSQLNVSEVSVAVNGPLGGVAKSASSTHTAVVNGQIWTKSLSVSK